MTKHINRAVGRKLRQQGHTGKAAEQGKTNGFGHGVLKSNGKSYQVSVQSRKPRCAKPVSVAKARSFEGARLQPCRKQLSLWWL
jgi:hypothetical protein